MGIVAGIVGAAKAVGAVAGAASAVKGLRGAKKASRLADSQRRTAKSQKAMAADAYQTYDEYGRPVLEQAMQLAGRGVDPTFYADRAQADVGNRFDTVQGQLTRGMERRGTEFGAGQLQQIQSNIALARAHAEAAARTSARRDAEESNWRRMLQGGQLSQQSLNQAFGGQADAGQQYGQLSRQHARDASGAIAGGIGMLGKAVNRLNADPSTPPHAGDNAVGGTGLFSADQEMLKFASTAALPGE